MAETMRDRVDARLPERAEKVAKANLRKAEAPANPEVARRAVQVARRAVLGAVLFDALVIMRKTRLKEQAAFLGRDERQVARWFNGTEAAPWEELLTIRDLQFPLMQALLEACQRDLVEIDTVIRRRPSPKTSEAA
jgi:hypothetical protein